MSLAVPTPSVCDSASSRPSTSHASYFSIVSHSTATTSPEEATALLPPTLPPLDPATKASTIRLPLQLPAPPADLPDVDLSTLTVDDELEDAPVGFAVGKLRQMGPSLLLSTTATCLHIAPGPTLPPYLEVTFPDSPSAGPSLYLPSHVLAIHSSDSPRTLLLPVHGLLFASMSAPLSILSSRPEKQLPHPSLPSTPRPTQSSAYLPVVELTLASVSAFPLLQGWLYLRSPAILLSSLLPQPPTPACPTPSSLSHLLNPSPPTTAAPIATPSSQSLTVSLSALPSSKLLKHIHLVHGLWQDVVALQIADEELWKAMGIAWRVLIGALGAKEGERRRRGRTASSGSEGEVGV
ncbi:uncharacterized protein JCM10292_002982 [Rhodotorula paludigena]|uniref:uncharacterized protein n=1 Tax=Rhodotorula paludigena TaxID=86838 RepID=UPI003178372C